MLQKTFHFVLPAVTMCCNVPFPGGRDVTSLMYEANVQSSVLRYWCLPSTMCGTFLVLHITGNGDRCGDGWGCGGGGRWHLVERGRFGSVLFFLYLTKISEGLCFDIFTWSWLARWSLSEGNIKRDSSSGSVFIAQLDIFMIHSWIKLFHQWS